MTALLKTYFYPKAFLAGLGAVIIIYVLLFGYVLLRSSNTVEKLESQMVSQASIIERTGVLEPKYPIRHPSQDIAAPVHNDAGHAENMDSDGGQPERNPNALYDAPIDGLFISTPLGPMPKIADNGTTPFKAYKRPFSLPGKPLIAIAVVDYGLSAEGSDVITKALPPEVSFIVSPYGKDLPQWQKKARADGHELWVHAPTNSADFPMVDPGPRALLSHAGIKHNVDSLKWILTRFSGYAGVAMSSDAGFVRNRSMFESTLNDVHKKGLGFLELNPSAPSAGQNFAMGEGMPYIKNNAQLKGMSLKSLESKARARGYVVALVEPHPGSIKNLSIWINTLQSKGFALAPLSAVTGVSSIVDMPVPEVPAIAVPVHADDGAHE